MKDSMLRADCARCAALCCVALAFDRSPSFAFDKPAGEACPNLDGCNRCRVHDRLESGGFSGCRAYDCLGAGQRVTAMFEGRLWRDDATTARQLLEAFAVMREVCELLAMLRLIRRLPLLPAQVATCDALARELDPRGGWTPESLAAFELAGARRRVRALTASLAPVLHSRLRRLASGG